MKQINEEENGDGSGDGDDNDSVWGGDSTWDGGDQDDFSVSVYNAKAPAMGSGSRPKAVPISRIEIRGPLPPSNSEKRTPSSSHSRKQQLPPSGTTGKPKQMGAGAFHMSMGNLGAPATFSPHSKGPGGSSSSSSSSNSNSNSNSNRNISSAGFQPVSAPLSPKGGKAAKQRRASSKESEWHNSFQDFDDEFDEVDFSAPLPVPPAPANQTGNSGAVRVKSKAAAQLKNSRSFKDDRFADQARMHRSHGELPSFDHLENSFPPNKSLRRRSAREDNSDAALVSSMNESLSFDGFPRAAVLPEASGSRPSDTSRDRRNEPSARSSRSTDKPARSQQSLLSTNNDGEKERKSRRERSSDRSQRRSRSVDMSQEKPPSPTQQRRALRRDRSKSPGKLRRGRSKSPGKFKDRPDRPERKERATAERKERGGRSQSPGKFRNRVRDGRSKSPGALSRRTARRDRSSSPGRLSNTGSRRRAVENRTAPRRTKSDDLNNSLLDMGATDLGVGAKADEGTGDGRRRRGVARTKSMDITSKPRSTGTGSSRNNDKDDSESDQPEAKGDAERKPIRRTKSDRIKGLGSALKFVDTQACSIRKSRRRADDRSYKSEGSSTRHATESHRVRRTVEKINLRLREDLH
jgi:hypothetical protein